MSRVYRNAHFVMISMLLLAAIASQVTAMPLPQVGADLPAQAGFASGTR